MSQTESAEVTKEESLVLEYEIVDSQSFANFFDTRSEAEWEAMGQYEIQLSGMCTPVTVGMDGMDVTTITAFGKTHNIDLDQQYLPESNDGGSTFASFDWNQDTIVISYRWIINAEDCYQSVDPENVIYFKAGEIKYARYADHDAWEHYETAPLDFAVSRDEFCYEKGSARIEGGKLVLDIEEYRTVSDIYDLDTLFETAKARGEFSEYDILDQLLQANKERYSE